MSPTRSQKRWSPRLRTAGALLLMIGTVALVDRVLPGAVGESFVTFPAWVQFGVAASAIAVGSIAFVVGRRWR